MLLTEFGIVTDSRRPQPLKAPSTIFVTELPIVTEVIELRSKRSSILAGMSIKTVFIAPQDENAPSPMLFTEFGMVIDFTPLQDSKADSPILTTELGISIDARASQ